MQVGPDQLSTRALIDEIHAWLDKLPLLSAGAPMPTAVYPVKKPQKGWRLRS